MMLLFNCNLVYSTHERLFTLLLLKLFHKEPDQLLFWNKEQAERASVSSEISAIDQVCSFKGPNTILVDINLNLLHWGLLQQNVFFKKYIKVKLSQAFMGFVYLNDILFHFFPSIFDCRYS